MKSYKIINSSYSGNFEELKKNIFNDLSINDTKLSYNDNFKLIDNPIYWKIMINDHIIKEVKHFFNDDNICFIPFTSLQFNNPAGFLHRDNKDRIFNKGSDWNESQNKFKILRAGIYFSIGDYKIPFTIISNSHVKENILNNIGIKFYNKLLQLCRRYLFRPRLQIPFFSIFNRYSNLQLNSGECVIFNTKLLHQGGVINFQYPKIAMFFAFGVRNEHTYNQFEFMKNYKKKSNMQTKYWYEEKDYPLEFKNLLASKGLLLEG